MLWIGNQEQKPTSDSPQKEPVALSAQLGGETVKVMVQPGETVLDALIAAGHNAPYSCMEGSCMACMAKLKSGLVYQSDYGILTDDNVEDGEILTCQARPVVATEIDFDTF